MKPLWILALFVAAAAVSGSAAAGVTVRAPRLLTISVDHGDPANQQPEKGRILEYATFFTPNVRVHRGDTVNLQAAPGSFHVIGIAASEAAALQAYPVGIPDTVKAPNGGPQIILGPGMVEVKNGTTHGGGEIAFDRPEGPPSCGVVTQLGQEPCVFSGGDDVDIAGPNPGFDPKTGAPSPVDWQVKIDAPVGTYDFFCTIHPGMRGKLHVVADDQKANTQKQIDRVGQKQFEALQAHAVDVEQAANKVVFSGGAPGTRTYRFLVGVGARGIMWNEMFPNPATLKGKLPELKPGDRARFVWADRKTTHNAALPVTNNVPPFGFDCNGVYKPQPCPGVPQDKQKPIMDPGNAPRGTLLVGTTQKLDSGMLPGKNYGIPGSVHVWSLVTNNKTADGQYSFHCTLHPWMVGGFGFKG